MEQLTVGDGLEVEVVSTVRSSPTLADTLHLAKAGDGEEEVPVPGLYLQAAGTVWVATAGEGSCEGDQLMTGGGEVTLPGQGAPRQIPVEGEELTRLLLHTLLLATLHRPNSPDLLPSSQATRQVRLVAGSARGHEWLHRCVGGGGGGGGDGGG